MATSALFRNNQDMTATEFRKLPEETTEDSKPPVTATASGFPPKEELLTTKLGKDDTPLAGVLTPPVQVDIVENDQELMRIKSFFLFDPLQNELIIREKTLHVILREFLTSHVETMLIKDISLVTVTNSLFLSSIIISYRIPRDDMTISKVPTNDAFKAKALLDKLMLVKQGETKDETAPMREE